MKEDFVRYLSDAQNGEGISWEQDTISAIIACALGIKEFCEKIDKQNELIAKQNELMQKVFGVCLCTNHDKLYLEHTNES